MLQTVVSQMIMIYATICEYSIFMTNNAFKLQLLQMVIVKRDFKKKWRKSGLFTSLLQEPLKTHGKASPCGVSEFSGCLEVITITLLFRKKMYPIYT